MRLLIEAALLIGGALLIGLGASYMGTEAIGPAHAAAISALGVALALAGAVLTIRFRPVSAPALIGRVRGLRGGSALVKPLPEPLAVVHVSWNGEGAPVVLGASPHAAVVTEPGGVVHLALRHGSATRSVVCRANAANSAFFNTLKRARNTASIKLVAPTGGQARLEFWDAAAPPAS